MKTTQKQIFDLENECRDAHRKVGILVRRGYPRGYKTARLAADKAAKRLELALSQDPR